jgi:hypothetical protein
MINVKDNPNLKRDERSNSILSTNIEELNNFKANREVNKKLSHEVNELKSELSEIKSLLSQVLTRL